MTGIKDYVIGIKFSPPSGRIRCNRVERITVSDLSRDAIEWSPIAAMMVLDTFLKKVKKVLKEDTPDIVYLIKVRERDEILSEKHSAHDNQDYVVVTKQMVEKFNKLPCEIMMTSFEIFNSRIFIRSINDLIDQVTGRERSQTE